MARMARVLKRSDKMISVRGINVFPERVEEVLSRIEGVGPFVPFWPPGNRG